MQRSTTSRPILYLLYIIFIDTLGPLQFGYHLVMIAPYLTYLQRLTYLRANLMAPQRVITCQDQLLSSSTAELPKCLPMNASQWGLVQSIFTIGGLVGALVGGPLGTKYGRLLAMQTTTIFFIVGPLALALADNIELMILGRFLSGIGAGASTVVCPLCVAEVSPPHKRGLFGAFTQVMINTGILLAQLLGYFLSHDKLWRVILATAALIWSAQPGRLTFCARVT